MQETGAKTPYIIGLTGGIGSGKSTICSMFEELGAEVIDADQISHAIVRKDRPLYQEIVSHFGARIIDEKKELNRPLLRKVIFNDSKEKKWLESLMHPVINREILSLINKSKSPYIILSVPLLLESKNYEFVDRILVIDIPESLQLDRIKKRDNISTELAQKIINSQITRSERNKKADDIIVNDAPIEDIRKLVKKLHSKYQKTK